MATQAGQPPVITTPPSFRNLSAEKASPKYVPGVKIWALFGLMVLALETYVLVKWVTGPNFENVPSGPNEPSSAVKLAAGVITFAGFPAALWCFYNWVIKPWRRSRIVTAEGLMLVWFGVFGWFFDPFANFFNAYFTYNSWLPNMGSWVADVPLWGSITAGEPGAMQAYPLLFVVTAYVWGLFGLAALTAHFMRKLRARYPAMSNAMLLFNTYWFAFVLFLILEIVYMRAGIYGYHGTVPELTLWYGEYYQMPIYEPIFSGFYFLGYASLLYFRNDKGQTLVERGVDKVRSGPAAKLGLRFAAMSAACALVYMVTYNIPYWITNNVNEEWPEVSQVNSYWTNGICGPETRQACPHPDLPITRRNSGHFDPEGNWYPAGAATPEPGASAEIPGQFTEFRTGD
jgi:hypothetical protein